MSVQGYMGCSHCTVRFPQSANGQVFAIARRYLPAEHPLRQKTSLPYEFFEEEQEGMTLTLTRILVLTPLLLFTRQGHHHSKTLLSCTSALQEHWRATGNTIWAKRAPPCSKHYRITATKTSTYQTGCTMFPGLSL